MEFGVVEQMRVVDDHRGAGIVIRTRRSGQHRHPGTAQRRPHGGQHRTLASADAAADEDLDGITRRGGQRRDKVTRGRRDIG
jgi:hypothetical protein